jgi:hypothetical protein
MTPTKSKSDKKETVVIVNTESRLKILGKIKGFNEPEHQDGLFLSPGENTVDKAFWDKAKKRRSAKMDLLVGRLKCKGDGVARKMTEDLTAANAKEAASIISDEDDATELMRWRDADSRATVKKACNARLDRLVAAQGEDDED